MLFLIPPAYDRLSVSQGFLFDQEPVFIYKSSTFLDDPATALWVVLYTECILDVFAALLQAVFSDYRLWYVPTEIIAFARGLGFTMEVPLGSHVREVFELLDVIQATEFTTFLWEWFER